MPLQRKPTAPLEKSIPRNPRYEDIGPTVDTGSSLSKYLKKLEELRENFRIRDDEIFKRIKLPTFVQLIIQVHETRETSRRIETFDRLPEDVSNKGVQSTERMNNGVNLKDGDTGDFDPPPTARSTLESLVHGVGEFDSYVYNQRGSQPPQNGRSASTAVTPSRNGDSDLPYLLLDLRDREEYDACHIITALNYPIAMLSRSVNFETPEMLAFRNKPGCIIVLYDEDERIGPRAATTLVQRGYQNVFLLSGGLRLAWKNFPEGLIIGEMPLSIRQSIKVKPRDRAPAWTPQLARIDSASTVGTHGVTTATDTVNNCSAANSTRKRTPLIYCELGTRDNGYGLEEFLSEDILKLSLTVERGLDDGRSIRTGQTRSTIGSACQSTSTPSIHRKPFR